MRSIMDASTSGRSTGLPAAPEQRRAPPRPTASSPRRRPAPRRDVTVGMAPTSGSAGASEVRRAGPPKPRPTPSPQPATKASTPPIPPNTRPDGPDAAQPGRRPRGRPRRERRNAPPVVAAKPLAGLGLDGDRLTRVDGTTGGPSSGPAEADGDGDGAAGPDTDDPGGASGAAVAPAPPLRPPPFTLKQLETLVWVADRRSVAEAAAWSRIGEGTLRARLSGLACALPLALPPAVAATLVDDAMGTSRGGARYYPQRFPPYRNGNGSDSTSTTTFEANGRGADGGGGGDGRVGLPLFARTRDPLRLSEAGVIAFHYAGLVTQARERGRESKRERERGKRGGEGGGEGGERQAAPAGDRGTPARPTPGLSLSLSLSRSLSGSSPPPRRATTPWRRSRTCGPCGPAGSGSGRRRRSGWS